MTELIASSSPTNGTTSVLHSMSAMMTPRIASSLRERKPRMQKSNEDLMASLNRYYGAEQTNDQLLFAMIKYYKSNIMHLDVQDKLKFRGELQMILEREDAINHFDKQQVEIAMNFSLDKAYEKLRDILMGREQ